MQWIDEGRGLPNRKDKNWRKFVNAYRGWYKVMCTNPDRETQAKNAYYFQVGSEHLNSLGINITPIKHTGSLTLNIPKTWGDNEPNEYEAFSYELESESDGVI